MAETFKKIPLVVLTANLPQIKFILIKRTDEYTYGALDSTAAERKLRWDEENRLTASDADGERTVKTSGEGEQFYVNSEFAGGRTNTENATPSTSISVRSASFPRLATSPPTVPTRDASSMPAVRRTEFL